MTNIVRSTHLEIQDREKGWIERKGNFINYFIVPSDLWFHITMNVLLQDEGWILPILRQSNSRHPRCPALGPSAGNLRWSYSVYPILCMHVLYRVINCESRKNDMKFDIEFPFGQYKSNSPLPRFNILKELFPSKEVFRTFRGRTLILVHVCICIWVCFWVSPDFCREV